jgi:Putative peptidoglycan binding domain
MAAPVIAMVLLGAGALIAAVAASDKKKKSGTYELDASIPEDKSKQVLGAIAHETSPQALAALADKMDAQGWHLAAAALRGRAAELGTIAPAPGAPPATAIVAPTGMPELTPATIPTLDPTLDPQTRQAVVAMLTSVNDPAQLQGFASALAADHPISASLLWSKAAALIAQHPAPVAVTQAAPPAGAIAPGPAVQPAVQLPPQGYSWTLASDADVARDRVQSRYQALMASPVGTQVQEQHNGRAWQFRVISKQTDPGLTTYAKDVKGWIGRPPSELSAWPGPTSQAPTPLPTPATAPAAVPASFAGPVPVSTARQVQSALNALGYHGPNGQPLKVDGILGAQSQGAVRTFQGDHGLKADGIAGPITKTALATALAQKGLAA